ncbi:hypothetical protein GCM10027289_15420 [Tsukamurella serpentis]
MNPYGGQNPRPYPGGQYHRGGTPQPQPGYQPGGQQFGRPGHPQPTQQFGYPPPGFPPGPPQPPNKGGGKGVIIAVVAVVAVLAVAAAVVAGLVLRDDDSTTDASPVTFSATTSPGTGSGGTAPASKSGSAPTPTPAPGVPGTETDGFLTPTRSGGAPSTGSTVPLKLSAGGAGVVIVSGVSGTTVPPASTLPWEWQGPAVVGETLTVRVVGTGPLNCSISVDGREISRREGTNSVQCGIKRAR